MSEQQREWLLIIGVYALIGVFLFIAYLTAFGGCYGH